jgi:hypothetical protein
LENIPKVNDKDINYKLRLFGSSGIISCRNEMGVTLIPKSEKEVDELKEPLNVIKDLFKFVSKENLVELYEIPVFEELTEFLEFLCKKQNLYIKVNIMFYSFNVINLFISNHSKLLF